MPWLLYHLPHNTAYKPPYIYIYICICIYFIYIYLYVYLSIYLSINLSIYLSIYICIARERESDDDEADIAAPCQGQGR